MTPNNELAIMWSDQTDVTPLRGLRQVSQCFQFLANRSARRSPKSRQVFSPNRTRRGEERWNTRLSRGEILEAAGQLYRFWLVYARVTSREVEESPDPRAPVSGQECPLGLKELRAESVYPSDQGNYHQSQRRTNLSWSTTHGRLSRSKPLKR